MPYSLHPYQYGYSDPILHTDPSGNCPGCGRGDVARLIEEEFSKTFQPIDDMWEAASSCIESIPPPPLIDLGFLWGGAATIRFGSGPTSGSEFVIDAYTFEFGSFSVVAADFQLLVPVVAEAEFYQGYVTGWEEYLHNPNIDNYGGVFSYFTIEGGLPGLGLIGASATGFENEPGTMQGVVFGVSGGFSAELDETLPVSFGGGTGTAELKWRSEVFRTGPASRFGYPVPTSEDADRFLWTLYGDWRFWMMGAPEIAKIIATIKYNGTVWDWNRAYYTQ
jgi:hypothetical protein